MKQQIHEITVCGIEDKLLESLYSHVTKHGQVEPDSDGIDEPDFDQSVTVTLEPFSVLLGHSFKSVMHTGRSELFVKRSQFMLGLYEAERMQTIWY